MLFYKPVDEPGRTELMNLLAGQGAGVGLDRAALALATIEYPGLDVARCIETLDDYAAEIARRARDAEHGREFIAVANQFLFEELGIRGNDEDYYDPRNSCLNQVLETKTGIPITLSVLYIEIGRRLGKPIAGVGLPGHFVVRYDDGQYSTFIDPFHGGALLTADQCYDLARMTIGDPRVLAPVDNRQILFRMINNLRGIYFSRRAYAKALEVMDLLIEITPGLAGQYKQRGLLYLQTKQMRAAAADIRKYLELAPDAEDRAEMTAQLKQVVRWLAALN
jgi:regulator of sirC expression with transglutaminase-like and TPR domain